MGLLHDLGKVLYLKGCDEDGTGLSNQYGVVGDTFPVSVKRSSKLIFPEYNALMQCTCEQSATPKKGCGFSELMFSYGHDEYLWRVMCFNQERGTLKFSEDLPPFFLYIIRFHSFHGWHDEGAYEEFANDFDKQALPYLQKFGKYDLYTKSDSDLKSIETLKQYYDGLMKKWLGCGLDDVLEW